MQAKGIQISASLRPMEQISNLSISILPPAGSTRRNSELISVDFPLPVLPTTPILFPAAKVQLIPLRTSVLFFPHAAMKLEVYVLIPGEITPGGTKIRNNADVSIVRNCSASTLIITHSCPATVWKNNVASVSMSCMLLRMNLSLCENALMVTTPRMDSEA
ncbi:hypothetical protein EJB05_41270, partial [Eragrostis curvula]